MTAGATNGYTVDNASRITAISDSGLAANSWTFGYDLLDRVNSGTSTATTRGYAYDPNSNRLTTTGTTASTETIAAASNHLSSTSGGLIRTYSYDAAGNTLGYASNSYTFNKRGRMNQAIVSGAATNYLYNARGQLIQKSGNGGTTLLVYDEAGHTLGEYTATGALIQETIWMGNTPVATLQPNGSSIAIYYVHTDHLGTPRKITRASDNGLMWRWDPDTFGSVNPNTNPSGLGAFNYNLRFPGQYSLNESGLYYNYFRSYDPSMGRYIESDPIGLHGGVNTYAYVRGNPISRRDRRGLVEGWADPSGPPDMDLGPITPGVLPWSFYSNGNYFYGFKPQDGICTLPSCFATKMNADPSVLRACLIHDDCYSNNQCNASSWVGNAVGLSRTCQQCNSTVASTVRPLLSPLFFPRPTSWPQPADAQPGGGVLGAD